MRIIYSAGRSFVQGANDAAAKADEKPPMVSIFTYYYWIDTVLVTQKEYYRITGKQPVRDTSSYGKGDDYPVYFVSWFDAILFCNAKSKKEKLDTVYSYSGAPEALQGSVYNLLDVHQHYERNGYRLPTESEWEFAAREGASSLPFPHLKDNDQAQSYAWYLANSSGHTHPVAALSANAFGLYDMAGNVFEWTGDWKGFYTIQTITNSIGASHPNSSNERVVKGGSFKTDFSSLRPSHRSAIYETSPSTAAEYIGFRCARGVIPSPSYISKDTSQAATNSMALLVNTTRPFLGTHRARLVFVNVTKDLRTLCFVDFGTSYPVVHEFKNFTSVYMPVISPDGKYAAFCTRNDGWNGTAAIYIRNLDSLDAPLSKIPSDSACEPRWWVDPVSFDMFCIFTNSSIDDNSPQWPLTRTFMIKIAGGNPMGAIVPLISSGSYHDGRSIDGRFMVTGFTKLIMRDMSTGQDKELFLSPRNGKEPSGSTQVCNASIGPDLQNSDRSLFIDFGCLPPMKSTLTGNSYGIHEYLFIAEYSGAVLSWYQRPDQEASWDYPEWSNVGRFAVACARNNQNDAHAIYFVNLQDSSYCKVVEGTELVHPFLWLNSRDIFIIDSLNAAGSHVSLNLDSLGYYGDPPSATNMQQLNRRMYDFWRKHKDMKIVFAGSSHTANSIDPNFFSGTPVHNMAIEGGNFAITIHIIRNYLVNHCPSIQFIGCDVIPGYWNVAPFFTVMSPIVSNKGLTYDKNHDYWKDGLPENFEKLMLLAPCPVDPRIDTLGLLKHDCLNWGGPITGVLDSAGLKWTVDDPDYKADFDTIKQLAGFLANKKIHFLMYTTPETPYIRSTGYYSCYGASFETGKAIVAQFKALEDSFPPYVHFYDGHLGGYHDYVDSEAYNLGHLCTIGAKKFSARMDSVVHSILGH